MDVERIVESYLRHFEHKRPEDSWALTEVNATVAANPMDGWKLCCLLVNKATSDEVLSYVAAGPLENLLKKHGQTVIDHIEKECAENARLQLALSGVWGIHPGTPIFERWYALMWKYGFAEGKRVPL